MKQIGEQIKNAFTTNDYSEKIHDYYVCSGCRYQVAIKEVKVLFGPDKGKFVEMHDGCKCEETQMIEKVMNKNEERKRQRIYNFFDYNSLLNPDLQNATFENFRDDITPSMDLKQQCIEYVRDFNIHAPTNLLIRGNYGTGKSHMAVAITKALMKQGYTCIFIFVPKLLTKLRATYDDDTKATESELLHYLETVDLLVLDDIGAQNATTWIHEKLAEIVDSRAGKHTIYTTNLYKDDLLIKNVGKRIFSRMMFHTNIIDAFGNDYRLRLHQRRK